MPVPAEQVGGTPQRLQSRDNELAVVLLVGPVHVAASSPVALLYLVDGAGPRPGSVGYGRPVRRGIGPPRQRTGDAGRRVAVAHKRPGYRVRTRSTRPYCPVFVSKLVEAVLPARLGTGYRWLLASSWTTNLGDGVAVAAGPLPVASLT